MITINPEQKLRDEIIVNVPLDILKFSETRFYWKLPHERPVQAHGPFESQDEALTDARVKCAAFMRKFRS